MIIAANPAYINFDIATSKVTYLLSLETYFKIAFAPIDRLKLRACVGLQVGSRQERLHVEWILEGLG